MKVKNKVLVELIVPDIDKKYNLFLPANKKIGTITSLIIKAINDTSGGNYELESTLCLYSRLSGTTYDANLILRQTNIRNGTVLILM